MLSVRDGYQNDAACTAMRAVRCPIVDGRTQWMVLSAAIDKRRSAGCMGGTESIVQTALRARRGLPQAAQ